MVLAVFLLQVLVPFDGEFGYVFEIVPAFFHFLFEGLYLFIDGLDIEFRDFPDWLFDKFSYVLHGNVPA